MRQTSRASRRSGPWCRYAEALENPPRLSLQYMHLRVSSVTFHLQVVPVLSVSMCLALPVLEGSAHSLSECAGLRCTGVTRAIARVQTPNPIATPLRTPGGAIGMTPGATPASVRGATALLLSFITSVALFAVSTYQAMVPECSELSLASACRTGGALIFEERKRGSGDFQILQGMVARGGNTSLSRSFLFFRLLTTEGAERERGFWGCKDHIPFGQRLIMQGWGSKQ